MLVRRQTFLPFASPALTEEEVCAVINTLRSCWITTGPQTRSFEQQFATFLGAESALALNSCTAGLHLALITLGIGPGDEVITTPMTFAASANVIEHVGARVVLADVEPDTLLIDPLAVADSITDRTKAILPVHYAGHPAEMYPILDLAAAHKLFVIEDAAHALPASYCGETVGTIGDLTSFSFYATKNLTTAEGGMLTGRSELIEKARTYSLHGMSRDAWRRYGENGSWYYEVVVPGFKYNLTDIQAAMGLVQLARLQKMQLRRQQVVARYHEAFSNMPELEVPTERPYCSSAWHLYVLRLNTDRLRIQRNQFIEEMKLRCIGTSVHFIPIHLHPYYRDKYGWMPLDFPIAYQEYQRLVSLPLHPALTEEDVDYVIDAVQDIVEQYRC